MHLKAVGAQGMNAKCGAVWAYWGKAERFTSINYTRKGLCRVSKGTEATEPSDGGKCAGRGGRKEMDNRTKQRPSPAN
jgi:predicted carbohydrate-binding protein with CBM5 and CBM33 domain